MAWQTGTANDHVDLFNKIRDFLVTNTELVNAGESWTLEKGPGGVLTSADAITLRGPGLTGTDNIYCGMRVVENAGADSYNLEFWGHAGFSSADPSDGQPLRSPSQWVLLWNQPITYWIMASGRRWMLVAKVSTVYSSAYCGFMLPYASPSEYPYPMVVAGISLSNQRWSTQDERCRFLASPGFDTMHAFWPDNVWRRVANYGDKASSNFVRQGDNALAAGYMFPTRHYDTNGSGFSSPDDEAVADNMDTCFDGSYIMRDLTVVSSAVGGPYQALMGVLDGVYWIPGRANSTENIITKDLQDYLVVQNLFRTGFRDYMAMRLK